MADTSNISNTGPVIKPNPAMLQETIGLGNAIFPDQNQLVSVDGVSIVGSGDVNNPIRATFTSGGPTIITGQPAAEDLVAGEPVYIGVSIPEGFTGAQSNGTINQATVIGLVSANTLHNSPPQVISNGALTLTTSQWDSVVTGEVGGLNPGVVYYLDTNKGKLTTAPPANGSGDYIVEVGRGINVNTMSVGIKATIGPV